MHTRRPSKPLYSAAKGASMWRSASSPMDTVLSVSESGGALQHVHVPANAMQKPRV